MKIEGIDLTSFVDLTDSQKSMILEWRNSENIRKWMYRTEVITEEEHFSFCDFLKHSQDKKYFLLSKNMDDIGVIYFVDIKDTESHFGFYANPNTKIAGIGRILESVSINFAFKTLGIFVLKLEVFADNVKVRNLHKKYKFKETGTKYKNNKEIICMELKNETR